MFERGIDLSLARDHILLIHLQFPKLLLESEELSLKHLLFVEKKLVIALGIETKALPVH